MDEQTFHLAGVALTARASGALWWPGAHLLCVSDLHLGKSERLARSGGPLLPPYETAETLDRLGAEITRLSPATVLCLGDSFDDDASADGLADPDLARLLVLMAGRDWIWIAGNHDPGPLTLGGRHFAEHARGGLTFRHVAHPGAAPGEVSGHFHPKFRLALGGRSLTRACFLHDACRLILPAFGAYTGGLDAGHPALAGFFGTDARAILTGTPCLALPLTATRPRRHAGQGRL
jgi:DNA ligase-associated metallophosphoesterase